VEIIHIEVLRREKRGLMVMGRPRCMQGADENLLEITGYVDTVTKLLSTYHMTLDQ
jgi:hypothetical protein